MSRVIEPLPIAMTSAVRLFRRSRDCTEIASHICERGWRGQGVRVFAWPCGTVAVVTCNSGADEALVVRCASQLVATYARNGELSPGPLFMDVLRQLRKARAA